MLIKETKTETINYLENWPARYYDIPSGVLRLEYLEKAKEQGITAPADRYREKLCKKRFFYERQKRNHRWVPSCLDDDKGFLCRRRVFLPEKVQEARTGILHGRFMPATL